MVSDFLHYSPGVAILFSCVAIAYALGDLYDILKRIRHNKNVELADTDMPLTTAMALFSQFFIASETASSTINSISLLAIATVFAINGVTWYLIEKQKKKR